MITATPAAPVAVATDTAAADSTRRRLPAVVVALLAVLATVFAVPQAASAMTTHHTTRYERQIEWRVLKMINAQRRAHHVAPVTMNSHLILSGRRHNIAMARANTMSHQLPGEAYFATRISRAGYRWRNAGENIGWNSQMNTAGVLALQQAMYHEKAPYDGHKQNILSRNFRNVGVDVYLDRAHHKIWLTTDFGRH